MTINKTINKTVLSTTKKTLFSLLSVATVCTGAIGLTGCHKDDTTVKQVALCTPSKTSTSDVSTEFVLGEDNKTVEQITIRMYTSVDTLKEQDLGFDYFEMTDGKSYSIQQNADDFYRILFEQKVNKFEESYYKYVRSNQNISWISYSLKENETNKKAELLISFDLTDKDFEFNDKTIKYISEFVPFDLLYNQDEQRLEYNEDKLNKLSKKYGSGISCSESQKDISKTLHNKTVVNLEKVKKSSKK